MDGWREWLSRLGSALAFFTVLPLPASWRGGAAGPDRDAVVWFPAAGFVIGLLLAITWNILSGMFPQHVAAGLLIALGMVLTGGLHEDGLADSCDGLAGSREREKSLAIMRESQTGVYGVAALIFSIALRWAALVSLPPEAGGAALVAAHAVGRGGIVSALYFSSYARPYGTASIVAAGVNQREWYTAMGASLVLALLAAGFAGLWAGLLGLAAAYLFLRLAIARIGGYTGDVLGAMEQIAEITVIAVLAAVWSS